MNLSNLSDWSASVAIMSKMIEGSMAADSRSELQKSTASNVEADSDGLSHGGAGAMSDKTIARLKFASTVMGILIILCLVLLVYGVSQKAGDLSQSSSLKPASDIAESKAASIDLPDVLELPAGMIVRSIAAASDGGLWLFTDISDIQYLVRLNESGQIADMIKIVAQN